MDAPIDGAVYLGEAYAWVALGLERVNDIVPDGLRKCRQWRKMFAEPAKKVSPETLQQAHDWLDTV